MVTHTTTPHAWITQHRRPAILWTRLGFRCWTAFLLGVSALVALTEIDRILGRTSVTADYTTLGRIVGPMSVTRTGDWAAWSGATNPMARLMGASDIASLAAGLILWHTLFDLLFVASYIYLLQRVVRSYTKPLGGQYSRVALILVWLLAGAEVIEAGLLSAAAAMLRNGTIGGALAGTIAGVALAKWLLVLAVLIAVGRDTDFRRITRSFLARHRHSIWIQRLSVVTVAVFALATIPPVSGAIDQIPDALRRWVDTELGPWSFLVVVAYVGVAVGLYILGSSRAFLAYRKDDDPTAGVDGPAWLFLWLPIPAVAAVSGAVIAVRRPDLIDTRSLAAFIELFAVIAVVSAILRFVDIAVMSNATSTAARPEDTAGLDRRGPRTDAGVSLGVGVVLIGTAVWAAGADRWWFVLVPMGVALVAGVYAVWSRAWQVRSTAGVPARWPRPRTPVRRLGRSVQIVGNVGALLFLAIGVVALVRAFAAPAVLVLLGQPGRGRSVVAFMIGWVLVIVVAAIATVVWRTTPGDPAGALAGRIGDRRRRLALRWSALVGVGMAAFAIIVALVLWPRPVADTLDVMGTIILAIAMWPLLLGTCIVVLQNRRAPEVFGLAGMKAAPVLSIAAVFLIVLGIGGGDPDIHRIQTLTTGADVSARQDLAQRFAAWSAGGRDCALDVAGIFVRPMIVVAASGGGIRAAVWTGRSMATMVAPSGTDTCSSAATVLSSGVSGGSVGLAVSRASTDAVPVPGDPAESRRLDARQAAAAAARIRNSMYRLTDPSTLAVGLSGTLIGDPVATATGLRAHLIDGRLAWSDRAALMEDSWISAVSRLGQTFPWVRVGAPTGSLVLNSTSVAQHCRVVLSQTRLSVPIARPPEAPVVSGQQNTNCANANGEPGITLDFADIFAGCVPTMTYATAAMLSARFPIVTPSGRYFVPGANGLPCGENSWQFVDGGYAEGTGLGTVADIAPRLAELVADHNAAPTAGSAESPFVVPFVAYLDDEPQVPRSTQPDAATEEALVPLVGLSAQKALAGRESWVQRISNAFSASCPPDGQSTCVRARAALLARLGPAAAAVLDGSVITVAPGLGPNVEVPLGWTLSQASIDQLTRATGDRGLCGPPSPGRSQGFETLSQLVCRLP